MAETLRLLCDQDTQSKSLIRILKERGHDVTTVHESGLDGADDHIVLATANTEQRVVLTQNGPDFKVLNDAGAQHCGIAAFYGGNTGEITEYQVAVTTEIAAKQGALGPGQMTHLNQWIGFTK